MESAKTVSGTQRLHRIIPISANAVEVRDYSASYKSRNEDVAKCLQTFTGNLTGYVPVNYDGQWWLACFVDANHETHHPKIIRMDRPTASFSLNSKIT